MDEKDLLKHYGGVNPYDGKALEQHNALVNFVDALDQDNVDMARLRKLLFNGVPLKGEKLYYKESELTPSNLEMTEQLSYALRGLGWRVMLGVYGTQTSKWPEEMKRNIDGYEMWRHELLKDLSHMRQLYEAHATHKDLRPEEVEQIYLHDFKIAMKYHKHMRLQMIRKMRKTQPTAQQICEDEEFM